MSVITTQGLKDATDKIARIHEEWSILNGQSADLTVTTGGTMQARANALLAVSTGSADYEVEKDLNDIFYQIAGQIDANAMLSNAFPTVIQAFNDHISKRSTDSNYTSLTTYIDYINNPTGTAQLWLCMIDPWFAAFYSYLQGSALTVESVSQKPIHPDWRNTLFTDSKAMGQRAVGGAFAAGYAADALYASINPTVEVTADFSAGGADPTVAIAGLDQDGAAQTWNATVTGGNNPVSAVATTITPSVSTMTRSTVAVASLTGIVAGSVLKVNAGLSDEEVILVESIDSGAVTITAVFRLSHTAGAALTGKTTWLTTGTAGKRLRSVTDITIGITGHATGTVRVTGLPVRIAV